MSILAVLGWLLLGVLALVGLVVLGVGLWFWRSYRAVVHDSNPFDCAPGHFVLQTREGSPDPGRLARLELDAEPVGGFTLNTQIGSLAVDLLLAPTRSVLVALVSAPSHGEWVMTHRIRPDGRLDTWTNAYGRFHAAWSPGDDVIHWPGAAAAQLFDAAGNSTASTTSFPAQLRELRDLYAREIVASWVSRYRHGPGEFGWSDLLPFKPEAALDAEQWRTALAEAAPKKLAELCASGFVHTANFSVSRWAEHRDRLLFVHEQMPAGTLAAANEWDPFLFVTGELGQALGKLGPAMATAAAMDALQQANQALPENQRYIQLAEFEWPCRGAVYAAPEPASSLLDFDDLDEDDLDASASIAS